jgi:hypothetical protein
VSNSRLFRLVNPALPSFSSRLHFDLGITNYIPPSHIMEERAALPVNMPHMNPTISYWQGPEPDIADFLSSDTIPDLADTVIIGSGITGAFTAWNLLQKKDHGKIVMLEARQACSGATGRNGMSLIVH